MFINMLSISVFISLKTNKNVYIYSRTMTLNVIGWLCDEDQNSLGVIRLLPFVCPQPPTSCWRSGRRLRFPSADFLLVGAHVHGWLTRGISTKKAAPDLTALLSVGQTENQLTNHPVMTYGDDGRRKTGSAGQSGHGAERARRPEGGESSLIKK